MTARSVAPSVLLAACAELPRGDGDDDAVLDALAEVGVSAGWTVWGKPDTERDPADLVVLRATWDYTDRCAEFLGWCDAQPALANPAPVVRWNVDKSYLVELAGAGVPVVPTSVVPPGGSADWPDLEFVVKPAVGAGSVGARRFAPDRAEQAAAHLAELHAAGRSALVQPYQPAVDAEGELSLVFLAGVYSHSFGKGPMLAGPGTVADSGLYLTERLAPATPDAARRRLAEDALDAVSERLGVPRADLLYARVDVVQGLSGRPLLLELELVEPTLGFRLAEPAAAFRFASAIRAALRR